MDYVRTLSPDEQTLLQAKADASGTSITALLDTKIAQYIADVTRDANAPLDAQIAAKLATKTAEEKAALLNDPLLSKP